MKPAADWKWSDGAITRIPKPDGPLKSWWVSCQGSREAFDAAVVKNQVRMSLARVGRLPPEKDEP